MRCAQTCACREVVDAVGFKVEELQVFDGALQFGRDLNGLAFGFLPRTEGQGNQLRDLGVEECWSERGIARHQIKNPGVDGLGQNEVERRENGTI